LFPTLTPLIAWASILHQAPTKKCAPRLDLASLQQTLLGVLYLSKLFATIWLLAGQENSLASIGNAIPLFPTLISFASEDTSSSKKISPLHLLCYCGYLLFKEDLSFATVDISSSKKISPLPLWTSPLKRRYLYCISFAIVDISSSKKICPLHLLHQCGHLLFKGDISTALPLPLWISPLKRRYRLCQCGHLLFKKVSPLHLLCQ
jgi:hypothetical protein